MTDYLCENHFTTISLSISKKHKNRSHSPKQKETDYKSVPADVSDFRKEKNNPEADVGELEREIDWMVYELYGLREEKRKIIEG